MTVEIFTLCEYASKNNGSLSLQGTFDSWRSRDFPAVVPQICIALRIRLPASAPVAECKLVFVDPEGNPAFKPARLVVKGPVTNFVFMNRSVALAKAGTYHAVILANEKLIASRPLFAVKATRPQPAPSLN